MKGWGFPWEEWPQDLKDQYAYNPALAKKLLTEAGYPHGFKTNIIADTTGDMVLLDIVRQYFKDVGIDMEIRMLESTEWIKYVLTNVNTTSWRSAPSRRWGTAMNPSAN